VEGINLRAVLFSIAVIEKEDVEIGVSLFHAAQHNTILEVVGRGVQDGNSGKLLRLLSWMRGLSLPSSLKKREQEKSEKVDSVKPEKSEADQDENEQALHQA